VAYLNFVPSWDSCRAYPTWTMSVIERCEHTNVCGKSSKDNENVKNLMRREEIVESAWGQSLWDSICANISK
jgi:hypothetical protein